MIIKMEKSVFFCIIVYMKYVIFDFNGTIVDDVDLCLASLNRLIDKYLNRKHVSKEEYREVFSFPIIDYYSNVGFDFETLDWYKIAREFHDYYLAHIAETKLYDGVIDLLEYTKKKGYKNIILSASRIDMLKNHLELLKVKDYFDEILGIDDIYANSKIHLAKRFIAGKNTKDCIYLGDSQHDFETAKEMNVECVLFSKGHVSKDRLAKCGCKVIDKIEDFKLCV